MTKNKKKDEDLGLAHDLLLKEVDEEVRAERLRQWWDRFGSWLVAAAVAVILVTILFELWQNHQHKAGQEATAILLLADKLYQEGQIDQAVAKLQSPETKAGGVALLAKLRAANILYASNDKNKIEQATELYEQLAAASDNEAIRNYSLLKLHRFDEIKAGGPFYATAQELKAQRLYDNGNVQAAHEIISALLARPDIPPTMHSRLELLKAGYR